MPPLQCLLLMKNKLIAIIASILLLCSCGPKKEAERKVTIGVSVATMQEAVYSFMKQSMINSSQKDGVEVIWLSADNDEEKQKQQIDELIRQKVDVIVFHTVNTKTSSFLVSKSYRAGIPVVAMDRLPQGAKIECYVTADSFKVGKIQAQYMAGCLGGKGNVIICKGEEGNNVAEEITKGNKEVLSKYSEMRITLIKPHKFWSRSLAKETVLGILKKDPSMVQGILCNNSSMAIGAIDAIKECGLTSKIFVVGADADYDACEAIVNGQLSADVDKMPCEIGLASYQTALAVVREKSFPADKAINNAGARVRVRLTPIKLITKNNIDDMLYRWPQLKVRKK